MKKSVILAVLLVLAIISPCFASANYKLTDLGTLPGCIEAMALGVNNRGEVVGIACPAIGSNQWYHAFYWSKSTGMIDLGQGVAYGINNKGQIAGCCLDSDSVTACIWDSLTSKRFLGQGECNAINDLGQTTGYVPDIQGYCCATYWDANGNSTDIGMQLGARVLYGYAINNNGLVACNGGGHSYIYNPITGQSTSLMPLSGGSYCYVEDMNDLGQAVGSSEMNGTTQYLTVWNADASTRIFRKLVIYSTRGAGINNLGQVAAAEYIWNQDGTIVNLGSGSYARDINDNGWVVGMLNSHAAVWQPVPEPSSILALLSGIAGLSGLALRRRK